MSISFYEVTQPNTTYTTDDAMFDDAATSGFLEIFGSSNTVLLESSGSYVNIEGTGNALNGSSINGASAVMYGANNSVSLGANSHVTDNAASDTITVGANSWVYAAGSNSTINATQGGTQITAFDANTVSGNNDVIDLCATTHVMTINGNGNSISASTDVQSSYSVQLSVNGSNNSINIGQSVDQNNCPIESVSVATSSGSFIENGNTIVLLGGASLNSNILSYSSAYINLGNGNILGVGNLQAGTSVESIDASGNATWSVLQNPGLQSAGVGASANPQAQQLVQSMASYAAAPAGVSSTLTTQDSAASAPLLAASHH
ncbi:hypothetical protein WJ542_30465 [Paraburkholderia sp. B3]|uniref:hypothetical protein n=1 Tax=Paraburkholderia sp. B3 TaxID=3134791 RepID=UPI0039821B2A